MRLKFRNMIVDLIVIKDWIDWTACPDLLTRMKTENKSSLEAEGFLHPGCFFHSKFSNGESTSVFKFDFLLFQFWKLNLTLTKVAKVSKCSLFLVSFSYQPSRPSSSTSSSFSSRRWGFLFHTVNLGCSGSSATPSRFGLWSRSSRWFSSGSGQRRGWRRGTNRRSNTWRASWGTVPGQQQRRGVCQVSGRQQQRHHHHHHHHHLRRQRRQRRQRQQRHRRHHRSGTGLRHRHLDQYPSIGASAPRGIGKRFRKRLVAPHPDTAPSGAWYQNAGHIAAHKRVRMRSL